MNKKLAYCAAVCVAACVFAGYGYSYSQEPEDGDGIEKEASPVTFCIGFTAYYANWAPVWKIYKFFEVDFLVSISTASVEITAGVIWQASDRLQIRL